MVQAARSGKQNIAEGSQASGTSKEMEIKLVNVARASLEELLVDYQDFLSYMSHKSYKSYKPYDSYKPYKPYESYESHKSYKSYLLIIGCLLIICGTI